MDMDEILIRAKEEIEYQWCMARGGIDCLPVLSETEQEKFDNEVSALADSMYQDGIASAEYLIGE
jgi:hypothetical protein